MMKGLALVAVGLFMTARGPVPAEAQVLFGTVVGNVTDQSGAGVPGAAVKVTATSTNESRAVQTNDSGGYTASTVPPGTYRVEITKEGFRGFVAANVLVNQNNVVRVDAQLQVGAQTQSIEVSAEAAALQADRADVHAEVSTAQLGELPQPTRSYGGLLATVPGITYQSSQLAGGTNNPSKSISFSYNGTPTSSSTVRIEGVSARNPWSTNFTTFVPSIESIQNVNVATSTSDSEQAFSGGASVNVMLKSGSNTTHGAAYIYNIDNYFTANNFFAPAGSKPAHNIDNDTGGNIGGHILKDKLFYFGGYEGDYTRGSDSGIVSIPRQRELTGDFSLSPTPVYDPMTGGTGADTGKGRTAFPGNMIPASRINPVITKIVPFIPKNNIDAVNNNYYLNRPTVYNLHKMDSKVDYNATQKLRLSGRWGYQPYYNFQAPIYGETLGGVGSVGNSQSEAGNYLQYGATLAISATGTYVASPTLVIDGTFGVTQAHQLLFPNLTNVRYGSDVLGIPGVNLGTLPWAGGVPNFNIGGYSNMGYSYPALEYRDPIFEYSANATKTQGKHNIRFGFDIQRTHVNHIEVAPSGFTFSGGPTIVSGGPAANSYNNVATFLLGLSTTERNNVQNVQPYETFRDWEFGIYVRDQWQLTRKLTVQYGVRWEYYPVPTQKARGITVYDLPTDTLTVCGTGGQPIDCGIHLSHKLFSPNIGFAYRMFENFVIRGGFSISPSQDNLARGAIFAYPDALSATINAPNPTAFSWAGDITTGIPVIPKPTYVNGKTLAPPNTGNLNDMHNLNWVRGYVETGNFTVQKQLNGGWIAQGGYLWTHAVKLDLRRNYNYGQLGGGPASQPLFPFGITSAVTISTPSSYSTYNALQSTVRKRLGYGLTLNLAYTYSKYISHPINVAIPQYDYLNNGVPDASDRTHTLVMTGAYEVPFGKGRKYFTHGIPAAILGRWNINSVFDHHSGGVFSIGADGSSCNCPGSTQRVDLIKASVETVGRGVGGAPYFDPTAFRQVTAVRFGNLGYNTLRGPGSTNVDLSLIRTVPVTERISFQLRGEALNLTNTPHLGNPGTTLANASFNADGSARNLGGFSQITTTSNTSRLIDARYFRFGFRIMF
jgi:hypothetical protein